jgi:hypothetical protein
MTSLFLALLLALGILFPLEIKRTQRAIRQSKHGKSPSGQALQLFQGPLALGISLAPSIILTQSGSPTTIAISFTLLSLWVFFCLQKLSISQEVLQLLEARNQKL